MKNDNKIKKRKISPKLIVAMRLFISYAESPIVTIFLLSVKPENFQEPSYRLAYGLLLMPLTFYFFALFILNILLLNPVNFKVTNKFKALNVIFILILYISGYVSLFSYYKGFKDAIIYYLLAAALLYSSVITFFMLKKRKFDNEIEKSVGTEITTNENLVPIKIIDVEDIQFDKSKKRCDNSIGISFCLIFFISVTYSLPFVASIVPWLVSIFVLVYLFSAYKLKYVDTYKRHLVISGIAYFIVNVFVTLVHAKVFPLEFEIASGTPILLFLMILFTTLPLMRPSRSSKQEIN